MTDPTRPLQFADRLRQLRKAAGLTGRSLAELTGWQPSKISRLENGQNQISEADLVKWAEAVGLSDDTVADLRAELQAIRLDEARWRSRLRAAGHESAQLNFGKAEAAAHTIDVFETALAPGLGQTPAYARDVFTSMATLKGAGDDIDAAVAARMRRQELLYDESKEIRLLMLAAALRSSVASAATMAGQRDRLMSLSALPHVQFGIVPEGVELPFVPLHGFTILDDLLIAEMLHTEVITRHPDDVRLYRSFVDAMWSVAVKGDTARALLLSALG